MDALLSCFKYKMGGIKREFVFVVCILNLILSLFSACSNLTTELENIYYKENPKPATPSLSYTFINTVTQEKISVRIETNEKQLPISSIKSINDTNGKSAFSLQSVDGFTFIGWYECKEIEWSEGNKAENGGSYPSTTFYSNFKSTSSDTRTYKFIVGGRVEAAAQYNYDLSVKINPSMGNGRSLGMVHEFDDVLDNEYNGIHKNYSTALSKLWIEKPESELSEDEEIVVYQYRDGNIYGLEEDKNFYLSSMQAISYTFINTVTQERSVLNMRAKPTDKQFKFSSIKKASTSGKKPNDLETADGFEFKGWYECHEFDWNDSGKSLADNSVVTAKSTTFFTNFASESGDTLTFRFVSRGGPKIEAATQKKDDGTTTFGEVCNSVKDDYPDADPVTGNKWTDKDETRLAFEVDESLTSSQDFYPINVSYSIRFMFENADDDDFSDGFESRYLEIKKYGKAGSNTNVKREDYELKVQNFENDFDSKDIKIFKTLPEPIEQQTINVDGTTVVEVKYKRLVVPYTVQYYLQLPTVEGLMGDGLNSTSPYRIDTTHFKGKVQATIKLSDFANPLGSGSENFELPTFDSTSASEIAMNGDTTVVKLNFARKIVTFDFYLAGGDVTGHEQDKKTDINPGGIISLKGRAGSETDQMWVERNDTKVQVRLTEFVNINLPKKKNTNYEDYEFKGWEAYANDIEVNKYGKYDFLPSGVVNGNEGIVPVDKVTRNYKARWAKNFTDGHTYQDPDNLKEEILERVEYEGAELPFIVKYPYDVKIDDVATLVNSLNGQKDSDGNYVRLDIDISGTNIGEIPMGSFTKDFREDADNTALYALKLPESVKTIGTLAFLNNINMVQITLDKSLIIIGDRAFQGCRKLENFVIPAENLHYENLSENDKGGLVQTDRDENNNIIYKTLITYGSASDTVILPADIDEIAFYAFSGCFDYDFKTGEYVGGLKEFIVTDTLANPSRLKIIRNNAFLSCMLLNRVELPKSLKTIEQAAFALYNFVENVTIKIGAEVPPSFKFVEGENRETPFDLIGEKEIKVPSGAVSAYKNNPDWQVNNLADCISEF